jgi:hypothetical protein
VRNSGPRSVAEKSWAIRFTVVTVLSAFFAVSAHLLAGGAIASVEGLGLGALSAVLVSMVALSGPGFWRVFGAMTIGQSAFHIFMGVGATGSGHHHHVVEPVVVVAAPSVMGTSHLIAALVSALVVSAADRAMRVLKAVFRALQRLAHRLVNPGSLPVFARPRFVAVFHFHHLESTGLVGSHCLRGPPAALLTA